MPLQCCNECGVQISGFPEVCRYGGIKKPIEGSAQRRLREVSNALLGPGCGILLMLAVRPLDDNRCDGRMLDAQYLTIFGRSSCGKILCYKELR